MRPSAADTEQPPPGQTLAVTAQSLYLINLLLLPGLAFVLLALLYWRRVDTAPPLARCHLRQTWYGSLWAGALIIGVNLLILLLGGYQAAGTWAILITYFTVIHASLVMLGILGLARAMAGQCWRFPLIGPRLEN